MQTKISQKHIKQIFIVEVFALVLYLTSFALWVSPNGTNTYFALLGLVAAVVLCLSGLIIVTCKNVLSDDKAAVEIEGTRKYYVSTVGILIIFGLTLVIAGALWWSLLSAIEKMDDF